MNKKDREWKINAAYRVYDAQVEGYKQRGMSTESARKLAEPELDKTIARIHKPSVDDLQAEMDAKCEAAGIPERLINGSARSYKAGHRTSTFFVDGRAVTYAEFQAAASQRGLKPAKVEARIVAKNATERFTCRGNVTVTEEGVTPPTVTDKMPD